ncbi:MAG: hypothetical protein IT370_03495 [Deltaproteobacteria bacterium]|nr:hypothetical protein [Deltaproteobacteria bacterium]
MAKPRGSALAAVTKVVKAATAASAVNQRIGADALALIRRRMVAITEAFFDIGVALRTLAQPRIYTALGHASFGDLLAKERLMSRSAAADLIRIAERYTRETAVALGHAKAAALVQYVDATPAADVAESLARADTAIGGKPVSKATATELERAARALRAKRKPASKPSPEERAARAAASALQRTLGGKRAATVEVRKRDGAWRVVLEVAVELAERLRLGR